MGLRRDRLRPGVQRSAECSVLETQAATPMRGVVGRSAVSPAAAPAVSAAAATEGAIFAVDSERRPRLPAFGKESIDG